ncbi:ABC transporter permease [Acetatifactor aquisgranensis]|uniref:ABC transporter permease n=1 Tax=Acetatifactor aquisgranensis TaxID=2941233 RepID=UPI0020416096|nr:ABC transporter permease subunit [Acetatifactor aquisgranensis]
MKRLRRFGHRLWKDRILTLMALPALALMILFNYVPMSGLVLAFKKFDYSKGLFWSPWNGLENFRLLFLSGDTFWRITRNTLLYYVMFTAVGTICEVALAIGIYELVFKKLGKGIQSILILPTFISFVAVSYIVEALLQNNTGLVNQFLMSLGKESIYFYMESKYWPMILLLVKIWKGTGYGSVLYLATLSGVDTQLYEAAMLDGANRRQQRRYITLPMLLPMITIMLLLSIGSVMHSDTGIFYQTTKNIGALYETTQVLDSYVLNAIMKSSNYGVTTAITLYQSVIGFALTVSVNMVVRKISPENALF